MIQEQHVNTHEFTSFLHISSFPKIVRVQRPGLLGKRDMGSGHCSCKRFSKFLVERSDESVEIIASERSERS